MSWIVKVVLLCFVVGFALSVFDIDPASIITNTWATMREIAQLAVGVVRWALPYILVGAVIVVPLALLGLLLRWTRAGRGP
ncbi:MAG TPA: hypothetical protein VD978_35445 [Azospirillum sp.]|nr:hypothetical protein [Azospirillum sp.]